MKYIKCDSCRHFNLLNSEYQIFCNACGKKIPNNFKAWLKKFPNKTFDDYVNDVGVEKTVEKNSKKSITAKKILQLVFLTIGVSVGTFFGNRYSADIYTFFYDFAYPVSELLDKKWERQYFNQKEVSLSSPFLLQKNNMELELTDDIKALIINMENYTYEVNMNFSLALSMSNFNPNIGQVNLKNASNNAITEGMNRINGNDLYYSDNDIFINQFPAIIKKGNFSKDGNDIYFKSFTCVKNNLELVQFLAFWVGKNEEYSLLVDRIIDSIEVN